jgi:hypothetical protein
VRAGSKEYVNRWKRGDVPKYQSRFVKFIEQKDRKQQEKDHAWRGIAKDVAQNAKNMWKQKKWGFKDDLYGPYVYSLDLEVQIKD